MSNRKNEEDLPEPEDDRDSDKSRNEDDRPRRGGSSPTRSGGDRPGKSVPKEAELAGDNFVDPD